MSFLMKIKKYDFPLILIIILGAFIRLFELGKRPFWWDEQVVFIFVGSFLGLNFLSICLNSLSSLPYMISMFLWMKLSGLGLSNFLSLEFILRFPSFLWGVFAIYLIYLVANALFDRKTAIISAFLFSLSAFHVWYSQEARSYTLLVLLVLLSVFYLLEWVKKNRIIYFYLALVFLLLSILTNFLVILLFLGCFALFLSKAYRIFLKKYFYGILSVISISLILFLTQKTFRAAFSLISKGEYNLFWIWKPVAKSILYTFENFNSGYNAPSSLYLCADIVFFSLFFLGVFSALRQKKNELSFILSIIFFPVFSLYLISFIIPAYLDRYLIFCLPFYFILVSKGLAHFRNRYLFGIAFFSISSILTLSLLYYSKDYMAPYISKRESANYMHHQGIHIKKPFKNVAAYIERNVAEGDIVAFTNQSLYTLFIYFVDLYPFPAGKYRSPWLYSLKRKNSKFIFSSRRISKDQFEEDLSGKTVIPMIEFCLWKYAPYYRKKMTKIMWPQEFGRELYLDKGELKRISYRRIWLLSSCWNRGELDFEGMKIQDYLMANEKLKLKKQNSIDGISIFLFEGS